MKDLEIVVISFCFNKLKGRIGTREKKTIICFWVVDRYHTARCFDKGNAYKDELPNDEKNQPEIKEDLEKFCLYFQIFI